MKLELKKEELITLSNDDETLPRELTPQIGGGEAPTLWCTMSCERLDGRCADSGMIV